MKLSPAQHKALAWLQQQGGSGVVTAYGRILAGRVEWPQGSFPAWLRLIADGLVAGGAGRISVTEYGRRHLNPLHKAASE